VLHRRLFHCEDLVDGAEDRGVGKLLTLLDGITLCACHQ